jgi:hypothetical protein
MTIEERVEMLEAELAASRTRARRLACGAGMILGALVVFSTFRFTTSVAHARSDERTVVRADEVRAGRFIVEDNRPHNRGVEQAIFGMIQDAPGLRLGASDNPQISISTHSGSYLYLADETGHPRITLQVVGDRSSVSLFNKEQRDLLDIALSWDSPSLTLTDENGNVLWKTP